MKTLELFVIGLILFPVIAFSQEYLPNKGTKMIELNANPFGNDAVFSINGLQAKYWMSNNLVLRVGLEIEIEKNGVDKSDYKEKEQNNSTFSEKASTWGIKSGIEYRILKDSKISPYLGLELSYRNSSSSSEYKSNNINNDGTLSSSTDRVIDGAWHSSQYLSTGEGQWGPSGFWVDNYPHRSFNAFGTNAILGSDFYFVKNFYFGFEVGLGYESISYKRVNQVLKTFSSFNNQTTTKDETIQPSSNSTKLSFYANSAIRVGVWF